MERLERLLMLLPRTFQDLGLTPSAGVKVLADNESGDTEFDATDSDPQFDLRFSEHPPRGGWYYLEAALTRHSGNRTAKIYIDVGNGYNETDCIFVPSNLRGSIREVLYFPKGIQRLRWDPMETSGRFSQSALIFHRITGIESYCRRAWRVFEDLWRVRKQPAKMRRGVHFGNALLNLSKAYEWSANLRYKRSDGIDYDTFVNRNDTLSSSDYREIEAHIQKLAHRPLISIVMPVYNPPEDFFCQALDSIIGQYYQNWELCLADDASTNPKVREIIEAYARKDSRIKVVFRVANGHISAASNSALELVAGDFTALMDQDDLLPSHALYHVAVEINRYPNAKIIYSDEDKIDEFGNRMDPYFKSNWNADLFLSQNMISHLGVYSTGLVRDAGGFRLGFEGSQDYDLALRCIKRINGSEIRHIPRVLYHWRIHAGSTAASHGEKNYAHKAGLMALQEHVAAIGASVVDGPDPGTYRVVYPVPKAEPLVSLIIPTRDMIDVLRVCIESILRKTTYKNFEIIVVDNQSSTVAAAKYFAEIARNKRVRVIKFDAPFNYSAINNFAVRHTQGEIVGLVNNDIEVIEGNWLTEMVGHALRPEVGCVGAKLLYADGRIQHAGVVLGIGGVAGHAHKFFPSDVPGYFGRASLNQNYSAVTAACLLVRRSIYDQVAGLDEESLTVAFNDVDFCLKVGSAGYRNVYSAYARLYHHESISRGGETTPEKQRRFMAEVNCMKDRWSALLDVDHYYNPNLSLTHEDFSLATHVIKSPHHGYPLKIVNS
ncbi:glycosyltransferase family 2 protein [Ralstonia sp. SET104]|uniref:glycosyltransferase family 2 protein n=1 Tax=Ralstonia sp. SET104 TaxID=2448774 RepID=UPI0021AA171D|nr:glycosyltransferase family 2 protein [Ralstonia sp. SET104]